MCPKRQNSKFTMKMYSKKAKNLTIFCATFASKNCHHDLSKIAQSGHTGSCEL